LKQTNLLLAVILLAACSKSPPSYTLKKVVDGDTLVFEELPNERYDLAFIDAPEREQPYGREAKSYLKQVFAGNQVDVVINANNRAELFINGQSINQLMVTNGHAWAQLNISDPITSLTYVEAQKKAFNHGLGLWSLEHGLMVSPWQWRQQSTQPNSSAVTK
jgi:endonuclease YncB( thermonuclease family)